MEKLGVSGKSIIITFVIFLGLAEKNIYIYTHFCGTKQMCAKVTCSQMIYFKGGSLLMCLDGKV